MTAKKIVVNATALNVGGAKTILCQFLQNINDENEYIVFLDSVNSDLQTTKNVTVHKVKLGGWLKRIQWDFFALAAYLKRKNIKPDLFISLQNTSAGGLQRTNQLIYLHQPIPFSSGRWSPFKRDERVLFLYKYFYSFFISIFIKKSDNIVVQTEWMRDAVRSRNWVHSKNIHVIKPSIGFDENIVKTKRIIEEEYVFYPASSVSYKNHVILAKAIARLKNKIKLAVSILPGENDEFDKLVDKLDIKDRVIYLGYQDKIGMQSLYQNALAVVFPSKLETFGLPLSEAASMGKYIIASDASFSREVLKGYPGVKFCDADDDEQWCQALSSIIGKKMDVEPLSIKYESGWADFFNLIESILCSNPKNY
ncbi:glycosyltransferase [Chromobacterium sinusclupearum]|uniref:glycosyltransferase n=1 Tax=Chromobacterium sinusclupearum TaxID=2077146 RepID=UPI0011AF82D2|nr:glycosyltransferase [Chromobacterium sinusclupearum]